MINTNVCVQVQEMKREIAGEQVVEAPERAIISTTYVSYNYSTSMVDRFQVQAFSLRRRKELGPLVVSELRR